MGPRLFRRGNEEEKVTKFIEIDASMGPRLFRRGNVKTVLGQSCQSLLQWGHVFSDVETIQAKPSPERSASCFNGATSFQTWKLEKLAKDHLDSDASMGPRLFRRGNDIPRTFET